MRGAWRSRFRSLRARLYLLVASVVVPVGVLVAHYAYTDYATTWRTLEDSTLDAARAVAFDLERFLRRSGRWIGRLAERPELAALEAEKCGTSLKDFLLVHDRYVAAFTYSPEGRPVCFSLRQSDAATLAQDCLVGSLCRRPVGAEDLRVWLPEGVRYRGERVVTLSYPLRTRTGGAGSIGLVVSMAEIRLGLEDFQLPRLAILSIVDAGGRDLLHVGGSGPGSGLPRPAADPPKGSGKGDDGVDRVFATAAVPVAGWEVRAGLPSEAALLATRARVVYSSLFGVAIAMALLFLLLRLRRSMLRPVLALEQTARRVAAGDRQARAVVESVSEFQAVAEQFNHMLEVQSETEAKLEESMDQLRAFAGHAEAAREEERSRIARAIHDELGQALTGLKLDLAWLLRRLPPLEEGPAQRIAAMNDLLDASVHSVRRLAYELRPGVLDALGLAAAIEWQCGEVSERTGVVCDLALPENIALDSERSTALFRILQEILTNIARHAHAKHLRLKLEKTEAAVTLDVADDGVGAAPERFFSSQALGILGMRERAARFSGEIAITSAPGSGTRVRVTIPVFPAGERDS